MCSQLFGESDPDQDVSPDTEDPEATGQSILTILYTVIDATASIWPFVSFKPMANEPWC